MDFDNLRITAIPDLRITNFQLLTDNAVEITWTSIPGQSYTIETSEDLDTWTKGMSRIDAAASPASTTTHMIDLPSSEADKIFYRVLIE